MILELHRQGLKVAAIARQLGVDRKTVRKYISRGLEPPAYGPRPRRQKSTDLFLPYLRERLAAFPGLTAMRLWRELRERGYAGGYTAVKRAVRDIRPDPVVPFEVRFETPPGEQAQVDLARFEVEFTDELGVTRIVWLFSVALGHSRLIWARFVIHQDLQSVLRCHIAALEAIVGVPRKILDDRMKTAVIGEDPDGLSSTTAPCSTSRGIMASSRVPAGRIARRPRAKSSVRFATFVKTSSSARHSAISTTSMSSSVTGSTRSPTLVCTRPRNASSTRPSPKKSRR